jgi:hypothetical protein
MLLAMCSSAALALLYEMNSGEGEVPTAEPEKVTEAFSCFFRCGMHSFVRCRR